MKRETVRRFNGYRFIRQADGSWIGGNGRAIVSRDTRRDGWWASVHDNSTGTSTRSFPSFIDACDWASVALEMT